MARARNWLATELSKRATDYAIETMRRGDVDVEYLAARDAKERRLASLGLSECIDCGAEMPAGELECPKCGGDQIPF